MSRSLSMWAIGSLPLLAASGCVRGYESPAESSPPPVHASVASTPPGVEAKVATLELNEEGARVVSFEEVLAQAHLDSDRVLLAEAELSAAKGRTETAGGAVLPSLEIDARARYLTGREQANFGNQQQVSFWRFDPSIALVYRLNVGEGVRTVQSSRSEQDAASLELEDARRRAMQASARSYHDLALSRATIAISDELIVQAQDFVAIARARQEAELANEADLARAEVELAMAQQARSTAEANWVQASTTLAALMRWDPRQRLVPSEDALVLSDSIATQSITTTTEHRPDVKAARARSEAADDRASASRWALWGPEVAFEIRERFIGTSLADLGPTTIGQAFIGWSLNFGEVGRSKSAAADSERWRILAESIERVASSEIETNQARLSATQESLPAAVRAVEAAQRNYEIQVDRFEAGTGLGIEVIEAQNTLARARLALASVVLRLKLDQQNLLGATGLLRPR